MRDPVTRGCDAPGYLLETVRVIDTPEATHLRYRIRR